MSVGWGAIASMGSEALGNTFSNIGSIHQGEIDRENYKTQKKFAYYNAAVAEADAKAVEYKTRFDQLRQRQAGNRLIGALKARQGMSGAVMDVGTPMQVVAEQISEVELENALIGFEGVTIQQQLKTRASILRTQGDYYGEVGELAFKTALAKGLIGLFTNNGSMGSFNYGSGSFDSGGSFDSSSSNPATGSGAYGGTGGGGPTGGGSRSMIG